MKYIYEPEHKGIGYYQCEKCGAVEQHTGIQQFTHQAGCSQEKSGEEAATYHFGPLEVICLMKWGKVVAGRLSMDVLKSEFPQLLSESVSNL